MMIFSPLSHYSVIFCTAQAYLPAQNFLIDIVGIHDAVPAVTGCVIAGTSTSLGFTCAQSTLNVIYPAGKLWND